MLFQFINYLRDGDFASLLVNIAAMLFVVFCTMPVHEYAHALAATKLGDDTPRLAGRLTLRPTAHLDPIGTVMILLCGFGYAKPVPVNINNLKNGRKSFAVVALAGPLSNIIMAFIFIFLGNLSYVIFGRSSLVNVYSVLSMFFSFASSINISLAVFNLLPVPPLDGSRILNLLLPEKYYYKIMRYEKYIMLIIFVLLLTNILSWPLNFLGNLVTKGLTFLASLPFKLFDLM